MSLFLPYSITPCISHCVRDPAGLDHLLQISLALSFLGIGLRSLGDINKKCCTAAIQAERKAATPCTTEIAGTPGDRGGSEGRCFFTVCKISLGFSGLVRYSHPPKAEPC